MIKEMFKETYPKYNEGNLNKRILVSDSERYHLEISSLDKLKEVTKENKKTRENLEEVIKKTEEKRIFLDFKLKRVVEKLRGALLAERNTTGLLYSEIVSIKAGEVDKEKTTAIIEDDIVFGISETKLDREFITPLNLSTLFFKNLSLKSLNKTKFDLLEDFEIGNKNHNSLPFEFSVDLRENTGGDALLILDLKDFAIIEIYKNDLLFKEKSLSTFFSIPVDNSTKKITLRVYPTIHKTSTLSFNVLGITDLIYQEESVLETKNIPINRPLRQLVIDSCDNSKKEEVSINYYISVNNKEYEKLNPVSKLGGKYDNQVQSILKIAKDSDLNLLKMTGLKVYEGDIRYTLPPSLQSSSGYKIKVYFPNHQKEVNEKGKYFFLVKEDTILNKNSFIHSNAIIKIDGIEQEGDEIKLYKGIRKFEHNFNTPYFYYYYLENIIGSDNIFLEEKELEIFKGVTKEGEADNKYITLSSSDILKIYGRDKELIYPTLYVKNQNESIRVDTIKLKCTLESLNRKTVPFISRILIRGL